jgi:hypothetical protein
MELDRITVRAVEILADETARVTGTGSMVYLHLTRAASVRTDRALHAAKAEFDKLPRDRRRTIQSGAIDHAHRVAAADQLLKPVAKGKVWPLIIRR